MLSSRYLHLHEALGLGPMWLKQGAKVLPPAAAETAPHTHTPAVNPTSEPAAKPAGNARSAVISALNTNPKVSDGLHTARTPDTAIRPSEKNQPAETAAPTEQAATAAAPFATAEIRPASVMVVSICPAPEDSAAGRLFSGETGILLDNMLAAIGLKPNDVHKTAWVKTASVYTPTAEQIAAALPQLQAELAASEARAVLFLGQIFEQPQHTAVIGELCGNRPHFIIPHPARLLRLPQLKRDAWETLKKLREALPD